VTAPAGASVPPAPARLLRHPLGWVALGLGSGLSPVAPGTVGSLLAVALWLAFAQLQPGLPLQLLVLAVAIATCIWAADWAARQMALKDPGCIVSDELAGQWLALLVVPMAWPWWLAAFALFRLFDIAKPWPLPALERLPGGWGIVADDLMAGAYAAAILLLAQRFA
jgi:phosphatidylglycerophosphatase A